MCRPRFGRYIDRRQPTRMSADTRPILHRHSADSWPILYRHLADHVDLYTIGRYVDRQSADISTNTRPIYRPKVGRHIDQHRPVCDGKNDEVLGPAGEGRSDGFYKIDANLLLSKKKKKVKFFYVNYICF